MSAVHLPPSTLLVLTAITITGWSVPRSAVAQNPLSQSVHQEPVPTVSAHVFPLRASENGRYLVDAKGSPFLLRGRTAWYIVSQPKEDYVRFLDDTLDKGFNAIELKAITHDPNGNNAPFAGNGEAPFLKRLDGTAFDRLDGGSAPDLTTPNEPYWAYVDSLLDECERRGIVVLLFPAYVGYDGGIQGWMQELVANGAERVEQYGAWIASRYKDRGNLIWMIGGDYSEFKPQEAVVEQALIRGLKSVPDQASRLFSAEWHSNMIASAHPQFGNEINFNGVYSWENSITRLSRDAYAHTPIIPAFLLEQPYDEEGPDGNNYNKNATQPVRRFIYWSWLNTIGGYVAGNGYIWPFKADWKVHLDSPGATDLRHLNTLTQSIDWWRLVPSGQAGMRILISDGGGTPDDMNYVAAAATEAGDLLVAYASPGHAGSFDIDTGHLKSPWVARWWDPTSGQFTDAVGVESDQFARFQPPGSNSRGDRDWLLLLIQSEQGKPN